MRLLKTGTVVKTYINVYEFYTEGETEAIVAPTKKKAIDYMKEVYGDDYKLFTKNCRILSQKEILTIKIKDDNGRKKSLQSIIEIEVNRGRLVFGAYANWV